MKLLRRGNRGDDVRKVQLALTALGYNTAGTKGIFGDVTLRAVKNFQKDNGLAPDGIVGDKTREVLFGKDTILEKEVVDSSDSGKVDVLEKPSWLNLAFKEIGVSEHTDEERVHQYWRDSKLSGLAKYPATEVPWCFSGNVEILTEKGFVKFKDLKEGIKVYQVNSENVMSLVEPIQYIKQDYEGDFYKLKFINDTITFTDNHKWWGFKGSKKQEDFFTVKELTKVGLNIPIVKGSFDKEDYPISDHDLMKLVVFLTDGTLRIRKGYRRFDVQVSRDRKIAFLNSINLHKNVYTQKKVYGSKTKKPLTVYSFEIPPIMESCIVSGKEISWEFVTNLSNRQCKLFLDTFAVFDGTPVGLSKKGTNNQHYYSNSEAQIDQLQYMHLRLGQDSRKGKSTSKISGNDCFNLTFVKNKQVNRTNISPFKNILKVVPENKEVYCVSVPEKRIVIRGENSRRVLITGNCSGFVNAMIENVGIRSARTDGAKNWLDWGEKIDSPEYGCIVVFTRRGGAHVGFCVGVTDTGDLQILGGNQGDAVNIKTFKKGRVSGYRKPEGYTLHPAPIVNNLAEVSVNEE